MLKTSLLFFSFVFEVWGAEIFRVSSNPVRVFPGSDALFQWTLRKDLISQPDFRGVLFGVWKNGYVSSYLLSVTNNGWIVLNPGLKNETLHLAGRVQWKGDLSKSIAAFQISHVSAQDQMEYGLRLEFGALKRSQSDFLSLKVEAESVKSAITAAPSPPLSAAPGANASFQCEFRVGELDNSVYDGITVGIWERGGIYLTLLTLTKHEALIVNPKLDQEVPEYRGRVHAKTWANRTSNTSMMSVEIEDIRESDRRSYGCSMHFGPFKKSLGASVRIGMQGMQDPGKKYQSQQLNEIPTQKTLKLRVGENVTIPCPALSKVISRDGSFKYVHWHYCSSKSCNAQNTKWSWIAGMNRSSKTGAIRKGPYANRANIIDLNGTLEINSVRDSDATDYRCTVRRINFTSPEVYIVALKVDTSVRPTIISRKRNEITVHEGELLYLECEAKGVPAPLVIWRKNGTIIQERTNRTYFKHDNATTDDGGMYKCEASNSAGNDSYMVVVKIKPVKEVIKTIVKDESTEGGFGACKIAAIVLAIILFLFICGEVIYCVRKKTGASKGDSNANGTVQEEHLTLCHIRS